MVKKRNTAPGAIRCVFSKSRRYRYVWQYTWERPLRPCVFIGLNPSTADEAGPDPTVRRCVRYAQAWGYGELVMLNLFAIRATDPAVMLAARTPIGPDNDAWLTQEVLRAVVGDGIVVAAWGNHGQHRARGSRVRALLGGIPLHYLTLTQVGEPGHPLYLKSSLQPRLWCGETLRDADLS